MKKKIIISLSILLLIVIGSIITINCLKSNEELETKKLSAKVLNASDDKLTVQDKNNIIYTFKVQDINADIGSDIVIEYMGLLNKNKDLQDSNVVNYEIKSVMKDESGIPKDWLDEGIFSQYYILAYNKLQELSLDEKIGQLFLVRYPDNNAIEALQKYKFGGYLFFEKDFKNKTEENVKSWLKSLQSSSKIPLLSAVDEEGGKVVRVSSNPNLVSQKFKSSQELYAQGGLEQIKQDTKNKSAILSNLGLNLNLAPVVDVSTNSTDYMYERSLGKGTNITADYAKTVIEASKKTGVSYTLKHFPGYGNNADTHNSSSVDSRSYEDIINNDLPPFAAGINVGAEAVLVSHNTVNSIDASLPASLSVSVHNLLRNELKFSGIIITDDLAMGAVSSISDATTKAILAGNDLIITTDYEESIQEVKKALDSNTLSEELVNKLAFRNLAWKYYKGLMFEK